jgi:hypothetical protein
METKNYKMVRFLRRRRTPIVVVFVLLVLTVIYLIYNGGLDFGKTELIPEQLDEEEFGIANWNVLEEDEEELKIFGELSEKEVGLHLNLLVLKNQ